jgi:hypothetical protein
MHASLALRDGVLYVAGSGPHGRLALFDLDGRPLPGGFPLSDGARVGAGITGLAVDRDRRLWLADPQAGAVRARTLFGVEILRLGPDERRRSELSAVELHADRAGVLGDPVAVACEGSSDGLALLVGSRSPRRHGLQLFDGAGQLLRSLRPRGASQGRFEGLAGVALAGRFALACEPRRGAVQLFRDLEFHGELRLAPALGAGLEPRAAQRLEDGRLVVAYCGRRSGVALFDRDLEFDRSLAEHGGREGQVHEPSALVIEPGRTEAETRVVVADADGDRVQVLTLDGRAYGAIDLRAAADR